MREILFRGKRLDNGEWVYGNYIKSPTCKALHMIEDTEPTISQAGTLSFKGCPPVDPRHRWSVHRANRQERQADLRGGYCYIQNKSW